MRAHKPKGSVVFNRLRQTWNFLWVENGHHKSRKLGTPAELPNRPEALRKAEQLRSDLRLQAERKVITVQQLIEQYRQERMPTRASTKRGYDAWLRNHILPHWGEHPLTDLQARPIELWLQTLPLAPKSKLHIRDRISALWDYAMWADMMPMQRNPMELVTIKGVSKRTEKPRSLEDAEFQALLKVLGDDICWRTMVVLAISLGPRISEVFGLQWRDVDWLGKTISIRRGVVKQIVDDVKTGDSAKPLPLADEVIDLLKTWKQVTQFSAPEDWIFASPYKLGRQPLSYTYVWETLDDAAKRAGIGHVSSHCFRHTYRTWLDAEGTPVGVQQRMMRHADIRTTMNTYGDVITEDMRKAQAAVVRRALPKPLN